MARYRVSNRNVYGFRDCLFQSLAWATALTLLLSLAAGLWIGPLVYRLLYGAEALEEGGPGSEASWKTPVAQSIADMEQNDRFTLITTGTALNQDTVTDNGVVYHLLALPSGERVVLRINRKAIQEMGTVGYYRLPVGRWREWPKGEVPPAVAALSGEVETGRYVDMDGGRGPLEEPQFSRLWAGAAAPLVFFGVLLLHRLAGIHRGRFAPAFLEKLDPLLPRNDLECWCAALSASHFPRPQWEGWPLFTGGHRDRETKELCRNLLANLGISDGDQGIRTVRELTDRWSGALETDRGGWDLCLAIRLLEAMYLLGLVERNELDRELSRTGRVLQRRFSSWEDFLDNEEREYSQALADRKDPAIQRKLACRRETVLQMKDQPYSPYLVPWYTDLAWAGDGSAGERAVVREVLSKQFVRR